MSRVCVVLTIFSWLLIPYIQTARLQSCIDVHHATQGNARLMLASNRAHRTTVQCWMQGWCVPDRKFLNVAPLEQSIPWIIYPWPMCPDPGPRQAWNLLRRPLSGLGRPPAPNGSVGRLAGFAYASDQVYWLAPLRRMHAWPTQRTPPLRSAKARDSWKSGVALLNQIWI